MSSAQWLEALRLRVQDIRGGMSNMDRVTEIPQNPMEQLQIHLQELLRLHRLELAAGWGQSERSRSC